MFDAIRCVPGGQHRGYGSVLDLIKLVTGKDAKQASQLWFRFVECAGEIDSNSAGSSSRGICDYWKNLPKEKVPGERQGVTPVAPFKELVKIIPHIRSRSADAFKAEIANDFVRKFAGDQTLHAEIDANNATFTHEEREDLMRGVPNASADCASSRQSSRASSRSLQLSETPPTNRTNNRNPVVSESSQASASCAGALRPDSVTADCRRGKVKSG